MSRWRSLLGLLLAVALPLGTASAQILPAKSSWRYLDDGSDQGSAWTAVGFADSSWAQGSAELGYGEGDERTVVSFGPNASAKYITTYFRKSFQVANPAALQGLVARMNVDDGAVVYLNGVEVLRHNMPSGVVDYLTLASTVVTGADENQWLSFGLSTANLVSGTNTIAVEVHQHAVTSSDLSFDLMLLDSPSAEVVRGPYLQLAGPDHLTLCWRTATARDSRVNYGAAPGALNQQLSDAAVVTDHAVTLTGLQADTVYYYSIGDAAGALVGDDSLHWFKTPPSYGSPAAQRIWVLGDSGTGSGFQRAVRDSFLAYSPTPPDMMLLLGDNAYSNGSDYQYQSALFDTYGETLRTTELWSTRGNHDSSAVVYEDIFHFPTAAESGGLASGSEAYYSFDRGDIHFVCLDSQGSDLSAGGAMATWLTADLAANNRRWLIAYFHHPPYTRGSHDSDDPNDSGGRMTDMRQVFLPILEDAGVDLVLGGHSHSYERSFLIDGYYGLSSTFGPAFTVDGGDGRESGSGAYRKHKGVAHDGTVYAVPGSSGQSSAAPLDHPAMFLSTATLGSMILTVAGDRLDAIFLDDLGAVADEFTMMKSDLGPTLAVTGLVAGQSATVSVTQATAGDQLFVAYSLTGPGPTTTAYGSVALSAPITTLFSGTADAQGSLSLTQQVPLALAGSSVWLQALELTATPGVGLLSNPLALVVP